MPKLISSRPSASSTIEHSSTMISAAFATGLCRLIANIGAIEVLPFLPSSTCLLAARRYMITNGWSWLSTPPWSAAPAAALPVKAANSTSPSTWLGKMPAQRRLARARIAEVAGKAANAPSSASAKRPSGPHTVAVQIPWDPALQDSSGRRQKQNVAGSNPPKQGAIIRRAWLAAAHRQRLAP